MVSYAQHVLIATGKLDWASKIEDEKDNAAWGRYTANLKTAIGPKGSYHRRTHNIMVSACSFSDMLDASTDAMSPTPRSNVLLFPAFKYLKDVPLDEQSVSNLVQGFLLPENLPLIKASTEQQISPQRHENCFQEFFGTAIYDIRAPTILVCSHNSRDSRCGILGPLLRDEFAKQLENLGIAVSTGLYLPQLKPSNNSSIQEHADGANPAEAVVNVGCISHIGGHVWAGNVIIYIPPGFNTNHTWKQQTPTGLAQGHTNALGGMGIWYGRVEPKHVEGILHETLLKGNVIKDMFRGGIDMQGKTLWL